jgi:hypothetical protein
MQALKQSVERARPNKAPAPQWRRGKLGEVVLRAAAAELRPAFSKSIDVTVMTPSLAAAAQVFPSKPESPLSS